MEYADMLFFDDEYGNIRDVSSIGKVKDVSSIGKVNMLKTFFKIAWSLSFPNELT